MSIQTLISGNQMTVRITGSFTFADISAFREVTNQADNPAISQIIIDCSQTSSIDSAALGMLVLLRNTAEKTKKPVILSGAHGAVEKVFRLSKFDAMFTMQSV